MTPAPLTAVDIALGIAAIAAAAVTLAVRSRATQALGFLVLGALLTGVWLSLGSMDVALAEAALGSGILGAILVWLAVSGPRRADASAPARPPRRAARVAIGAVTGALVTLVAATAWVRVADTLPRWDSPLRARLPDTGVAHDVTGVLLAFRAYDTLLESAVLLLAAVAVLALGRDDGLTQAAHRRPTPPSTLVWAVRISAPLLLLFGLWLLFAGSSDSGGAFQSGAVLCALLILMHTAGFSMAGFARHWMRPLLVVGVIAFIVAGGAGPVLGDPWLTWHPAWAFAAILTVETLLTAGIAAGLFAIYLALENPRGLSPARPARRGEREDSGA
ncbi:MnhB domain-containing protein [Microbacterium album]|uniref:DUF4040 domain-containing protein n=1 Tax=Microbacterium album TaxID=2053191 RepID=A0A917MP76_9MICO|nr:MnhB domain-containing protein [Microbacterium album]GGH45705.1 hypothetical protein GCM10010921_21280 [Microbacterium album]